jgi:hypothetical protein
MSGVPKPLPPSDLPLFRFGLRQLFVFVAALSCLLAGMVVAQGVISLVLLLSVLVVAAHVMGTALGSRLRAHADEQISARLADTHSLVPARTIVLPRKTHSWHCHGRPTCGWLPTLVLAGSLAAAAGGGTFLMLVIGDRLSPGGVVVGIASLAVLGGWFAFLASSFYTIFRRGVREAAADEAVERQAR